MFKLEVVVGVGGEHLHFEKLGGGWNILGIFTRIPGEMIHFDEHIFQMD